MADTFKVVSRWSDNDINELLSAGAQSIGAGSATDAGRSWSRPTDHPDPIVLAGGIPDDTVLPTADLVEGFSSAIKNHAADALMYGGWYGYEGCRQAIADRQNRIEGTTLEADNIIMHNGSSGCLENVLKAFIQPGDVAIVESPSFSGTVRAIQGFQAEVVEVPMNRYGIEPDLFRQTVERLEKEGRRVKVFYTIPDYHNPVGNVTSLEVRRSVLETCSEHKILIAEDAAYTEIYFDSPPPPSYYAMSDGHGVVKLCSFSKTVATGLRAGWTQAREEFAAPLTKVRFDMGNSPLVHYALANFIDSGRLDSHVESMRTLYRDKCKALCKSLRDHCSPYVQFEEPDGGYFLWVDCKKGKAAALTQAAAKEGLIFPLGSVFFVDRNQDDTHFRLAFTRAPFANLEEAGKRLNRAFEAILD